MTGEMDNRAGIKTADKQTHFVVTREFGGTQTMQEAFEQLIEKKTEERILNAQRLRKSGGQAV